MKGYEDSKYYEILEATLDELDEGKITRDEMDERMLNALDEELRNPKKYGLWLLDHFSGTVDAMLEAEIDDPEEFRHLGVIARKEIGIFKKNGFFWQANQMRELLNEAEANYAF